MGATLEAIQTLAQCWSHVEDVGPTLSQHLACNAQFTQGIYGLLKQFANKFVQHLANELE